MCKIAPQQVFSIFYKIFYRYEPHLFLLLVCIYLSLLNGEACVLCVLYMLDVLTYLVCSRALNASCARVLGMLHEMTCLPCFKKLTCLICFKKLACLACFKKLACLACFKSLVSLACFIR